MEPREMSAVPKRLNETEEGRKALAELAMEMISVLEEAEKQLGNMVASQHFDLEEELYLWSLLPSKVRTAIKRGN